jgi:hypothetical protein
MNLLLRIVFAVVVGMLVAGILRYFNVLNYSLDGLIGFVVGLAVFFGWDGTFGRPL